MASRAPVKAPALKDRHDLLDLGLRCLGILTLDDLWSEAVSDKSPLARDIGLELIEQLTGVSERSSWARKLVSASRDELNAFWPAFRETVRPAAAKEIEQFDRWLADYGGLGNAGDAVFASLRETLGAEVKILSEKVAQLDTSGTVEADLRVPTRVLVGVVVVCSLLIVALPIAAAAAGVTGVAAGSVIGAAALAGVGAGIAGGALIQAGESVKVPPPSSPS